MAPKWKKMVTSIALLVMTWHGASAQSTCMNVLMSLAPCINYLIGNSLAPTSLCCSQLNWVIQNQPECPCALVSTGGAALGIVTNQILTLTIPSACNLKNPSVSQCNFSSGTTTASVGSPASAPVASQLSHSTPSDTPTLQSQTSNPSSPGAGSKTVTSTNNTSSSASATVTNWPFCVALLLLLTLLVYTK